MTQSFNSARLADQCAIVTGASSGLGLAIAESMADAGAAVVFNYHEHAEAAASAADAITARGGRAIAVQADVSSEDGVRGLFAAAVKTFGQINILVANSGMQKDAPIGDMTLEDWRSVLDVDLTGQFLCCREAVRQFRIQAGNARPTRSLGSIICMSSVHQQIPWAGHINYAASKGGVHMFMQTLAQEVAADKIRVNAIAPGAIRTPINRHVWENQDSLQKLLASIPYGRIGEPQDVAAAAIWLSSDEADYVTGTTIFVDGGMTLYPEFRHNG